MKVGIIGRLGAGRGTLFESLTGLVGAAAAPSNKTRLGIARRLDRRVDVLTEICKPRKTVYAELVLALLPTPAKGPVDISLLREARDLRALAHVIGVLEGEPPQELVPRQVQELATELVLADMERADTRLGRIRKGGQARPRERETLEAALACLEQERPLRLERWDEQQHDLLDELGLISHRPLVTVVNVPEPLLHRGEPLPPVRQAVAAQGSPVLWLSAPLEAEIAALKVEDQVQFLAAYDLKRPAARRFVRAAFELLDRICFFTIGPDEVRAWPIPRGSSARRAARAIHSDLERGFIRAEVVDFETFVQQGSEAACRAAGLLRTEGKDYVVQDGDIITVRFNV
jgi:ribosome-binding ATPase YchF (GTP1/OBG family)